jgi:hypothetical protein
MGFAGGQSGYCCIAAVMSATVIGSWWLSGGWQVSVWFSFWAPRPDEPGAQGIGRLAQLLGWWP